MPPSLKPLALLTLGLMTLAIAPGWVRGQAPTAVVDAAGMFSDGAIREAREEIARIDRTYRVTMTVETVESLRGQGIEEFAVRRAEQLDHRGIFVLIARKDHKVDVLAAPRTLREELGVPRLNTIRDAFTEQFRKDQPDAGLVKGVQAAAVALTSARAGRRPEVPAEAATAGGSSAGSSPLVLRQQVRLTLAGARRAMAGAETRALEKGHKMNIAAVDDGGHLIAFCRMDGARPASVATATTKAVTAATYRQPTGPMGGPNPDLLLNLSLQNAESASGGKITTLLGGVPIVVDGQVIGALGVGGGTGEQDAEVAKAGVDAFLAGLQEKARDKDKDNDKEEDGEFRRRPQELDDEAVNRRIRGEPAPRPGSGEATPR